MIFSKDTRSLEIFFTILIKNGAFSLVYMTVIRSQMTTVNMTFEPDPIQEKHRYQGLYSNGLS